MVSPASKRQQEKVKQRSLLLTGLRGGTLHASRGHMGSPGWMQVDRMQQDNIATLLLTKFNTLLICLSKNEKK